MHFLLSLSIIIALTILMSTFFQSSNARYHYHKHSSKRHSHYHHRDDLINYISLPPTAFSPEPDDPDDYSPSPSVAPSPSLSYNHNAAPSSAIVPSPPPSYYHNAAPSNPVVPSSPSPSCDDSTRSSYAVPPTSPSYHSAAPSNFIAPSPVPSPSCDCDTSAPSNSAAPSPTPSCNNSAPNNSSSNNSTPSNAVVPSPSPSCDNSAPSNSSSNNSTPSSGVVPSPSPSYDNSSSNSPAPLPSPGYGYSAPGNSGSNQSPPSNSQTPSPSPSPSPSYDNSNRNNSRSNDTIPSNPRTPSPSPSCDDSAPPSNASSSNSTSGNSNSSRTTTPPIYSPAPSPSPSYYNPTPRNPGSSNSSSGNHSTGNSSTTGGCSSTPVVFDVRSFGAVGNGSSDDTKAFRSAWKAACVVDSAVLLVPADGVFMVTASVFSGPCKPGFVFQIDGVLMPPDGPDCWPAADSKKQWIVFYRVDGMTLKGAGTIEGNGEDWWSLPCKPHRGPNGSTLPGPCDSPALIRFFMSNNVTVRGLRIENSPQFHIKFDACTGVRITGMSISSPSFSPNTDGIHIENTKSVQIYNSRISNGDDCISIGTGCADVHIENVTCGPGHGISIGSLGAHNSQACVSNITVRNAMIRNSDNGVRIKTWQGGTGSVSSIIFDSIVMENVRNCITIDQYYCLTKQCTNQTSAVYISDVSYTNIKGTYDVKSPPVHFACSDVVACTNITMSEVELFPYEGEMMAEPFCWNAYGISETLTIPPMYCLQEGRPQSLQENLVIGC